MIVKLLFILVARSRRSRICPLAYLKGIEKIQVGRRVKVHSGASLDAGRGPGILIGDGVTLNRYAYVQGADAGVVLGAGTELNNYALINGTGGVTLGRDVIVGPGARLISYQHVFTDPTLPVKAQPYVRKPIDIGDGCWIGANAVILAGVTLGNGCVVGAGAVVTRSAPPGSVLLGIPARITRIRQGFPAENLCHSEGRMNSVQSIAGGTISPRINPQCRYAPE